MSKLLQVLRDRNKLERRDKQRQREELNNIRMESAFRAKLNADMKLINLILSDGNVDKVVIEVPKNNITKFMRAIYGEEMTQYNIIQLDESHFSIGLRLVNF